MMAQLRFYYRDLNIEELDEETLIRAYQDLIWVRQQEKKLTENGAN